MDARLRLEDAANGVRRPLEICPQESPLAMPEQPVSANRSRLFRENSWRLGAVIAGALSVVSFAGAQLWAVLSDDGMSVLEWACFLLFVVNLFWVSAAAGTALAGAIQLLLADGRRAPASRSTFKTTSRTAIIVPMYNEDPSRVMGAADAVYQSLRDAGADHAFDVFFLSDTRDAAIAEREEDVFLRLTALRQGAPFFYRRRRANTGRKAGNVGDFVRRWGGAYDYMVVFDADSLMTAQSLTELVLRMDQRPRTGLIQTLPTIINARTVFARTQQFAMRAYGPIFGAGLSWWSGGAGNFWGHNAIVRVSAFAASAGLPRLPGAAPLGGPILSHDFVEAALMRRAGWRIEIAPDIEGSYEEAPPTLVDAAVRDRRWAQGNLQHISLLRARGFHWLSRAHMTAGVMGYMSAVFWFALIVTGVGIADQTQDMHGFVEPGSAAAVAHARMTLLSTMTAAIVLSPKWLAAILWAAGKLPGWGRRWSFLPSLGFEAIVSTVIAPIQMTSQTLAVASTVFGKDFGWNAQVRDRDGFALRDLLRQFMPQMVLGGTILTIVVMQSPATAAWWAPIAVGLLLSPAICQALSERVRRGDYVWRATMVPEDIRRPSVAIAADTSTRMLSGGPIDAPAAAAPAPARGLVPASLWPSRSKAMSK